jgi:alginate O-acetyltransferase complex protein AlgJ
MTDADPTPPDRRALLLRRLGRWAIVAWFAGLLAVPPVLLAVGLRPAEVENRPLAKAPGSSLSGLFDTDWYAGITAWFTDRLPVRDRAIEADARIDLGVLGESPNPQVLIGSDDWLYLREGLVAPCLGEDQIRAAVEEVVGAERVLAAAGKELLLVVAPNKDAVYPEHLGDHAGDTGCADANRAAFRSLMSAAGIDGYLDTWATLGEAKAAGAGLLYHRLDTHWNDLGAVAVAEAVLEHLAPGLWDPATFVFTGSRARRGDLTDLMGLSLTESADYWEVRRAATPVMTSESLGGVEAVVSTVEGIPTTGISALMLHDSMGNALTPILRPYFDTLTTVQARGSFGTGGDWFGERLREADLLVLETVERYLFPLLPTGLAADLVGALVDRLPHQEVALTRRMTGPDLGTRWARATREIVATGLGEAPISLPDLAAVAPGSARYLVVNMTSRTATTAQLTWRAPGEDTVRSAQREVPRGRSVVVFDLVTTGGLTELMLHLGSGRGHRVARIAVVEVPPN